MPSEATPAAGVQAVPSIDGLLPADVLVPDSGQAVADVLADAAARSLAVAPIGGGTALALGNPPERLDLALSSARLAGILDYEPTDLVLSVGSGMRFGDVQAILAEHGQRLPLDAPDGATIGGLIATALAGPRRLGSGTLRDLLIGIAVAHPSGTVTRAGGMVVKNVTGFDLTRVYHGSLGTLGVIVSANFKVLPLPRSEATVVAYCDGPSSALSAAVRFRASGAEPVALEVARAEGRWLIAVRFEGRETTVEALTRETIATLERPSHAQAELLEGAASAAWWRRYLMQQVPDAESPDVLMRCAVRPRATADLVRELLTLEASGVVALYAIQASPGVGLVHARIAAPGGGDPVTRLRALQQDLLEDADNVTILSAPPELKRGLDVWGRTPETLDVMRSLKEQFDPHRVLNPGRFAGFV